MGIFVWEHSLTTLQMCCGANGYSDHTLDRAVWWHEMGRTERGRDLANVMLEKVWKHGATKRGETKPDLTKFIEYEYQDGLQHTFPPIADGGFINSLFYRKVQFSEALARQIPPHQLVNMTNFPLRKTEFSHADCNIEMDFHLKWRREHSDKYPLKDIKKTAADENPRSDYLYRLVSNAPHLPKMCADYLEAVQNEPVHYSDLPAVPDFETLERRTRKMLRENVSVTATATVTATVVDTLES